jgi:hypothetical protein
MGRAIPSWRRRATRLAVAVAALALVGAAGVLFAASPATATWTDLAGKATCDCVIRNDKGQYRAVFGYDNPTESVGKIARGENNSISPARLDGAQITRFDPGGHRAAFATDWVAKGTAVTWRVGSQRVTADWRIRECGPSVSLPADGNGTGPVVALALSVLVAAGVGVARKRRRKHRNA